MKSYRVTIQEDEDGTPFIVFPDAIVAKYGLKEGDPVDFEIRGDAIVMTFPKDEKP